MLDRVDALLEELFTSELRPILGEVNIMIDAPTRTWSDRVNGPTLNIYMHDIRENNKLRGQHPIMSVETNGYEASLQHQPLVFDLHYMVTAWAKQPHQEHQLLMEALMVLLRCESPFTEQSSDYLETDWVTDPPKSRLEELRRTHLQERTEGIAFKVAQYDMHVNPRDIWSVLDNEMHPAIDLMVTLSVQPYRPMPRSMVREVEVRYQRWAAKEAERNNTQQ